MQDKVLRGTDSALPHQGGKSNREDDQTQEFMAVLEAFDVANTSNRDYFLTHLQRYRETLSVINIVKGKRLRILELGGGSMAFTLLLQEAFPNAEIVLGEYNGGVSRRECSIRNRDSGKRFTFAAHSFNIEIDDWPFEGKSFDLVLCMEILEHLLVDPYHVFREAHRVLRPGGRFLVTTPNIISYESLQKILDQDSPYLFGIYSRHGAYGRHNREYSPWEVHALGESSGFDPEVLITRDVYPPSRNTDEAQACLGTRVGQEHLRHQNIFYLGLKGDRAPTGYPANLFDYDPAMHKAAIEVTLDRSAQESVGSLGHARRVDGDDTSVNPLACAAGSPVRGHARLTNLGEYTWALSGEAHTRLRVMLVSASGRIVHRDYAAMNLPGPVAPGHAVDFDFDFLAPGNRGDFCFRFDLVHEQVCWFSDLRSKYVEVAVRIT
jgi:SAM-dependent methyltransferase